MKIDRTTSTLAAGAALCGVGGYFLGLPVALGMVAGFVMGAAVLSGLVAERGRGRGLVLDGCDETYLLLTNQGDVTGIRWRESIVMQDELRPWANDDPLGPGA